MLKFDSLQNIIAPTLVLCDKRLEPIAPIPNPENLIINYDLFNANEISFDLHKNPDDNESSIWNLITNFMVVWVKEDNIYYEISTSISNDDALVKSVRGTSLCEAELSQLYLYDFEVNTDKDIALEDYKRTILYSSSDPKASLLHRALADKAINYSIKHVDKSIASIQRSFKGNNITIHDFFKKTVASEIGCLFLFDSAKRSISVYDLENSCLDCNKRIGSDIVCPHCEGVNIKRGYGKDTSIYVSRNNLADSINLESNKDEMKNCFRILGGDDLITSTIRSCNPSGDNYIYYFSKEQKDTMPSDLVLALENYDIEYQNAAKYISEMATDLYDCLDEKLELESTMMPTSNIPDTSAKIEIAKLTVGKLSPVAILKLSLASKAAVDNAVLSHAKTFINGKYKTEIISSTYASKKWTGKFKVTSYSDEEDTETSLSNITISINEDFVNFAQQKINKILFNEKSYDMTFDITTNGTVDANKLITFKTALTKYCLNRLTSFNSALQSAIDTLIELGVSSKKHEFYKHIYVPTKTKYNAVSAEMMNKQFYINNLEIRIEKINDQMAKLQRNTNFKGYLDKLNTGYWKLLHTYVREDTYENSHYISDGLTNSECIKKTKELITVATNELKNASVVQHKISASMDNLLALEVFKPLWDDFQLGNWIQIKVDNTIYRLRMISYSLNYRSIKESNVEFSDVVRNLSYENDLQNIIDTSKSMSSSYSYVERQSNTGYKNGKYVENWLNNGLDLTALKIYSNSKNQSVTYDSHGLSVKQWNDLEEKFEPEQLKITSSGVVVTQDEWESISTAVGKMIFYNPQTGIMQTAIGVNADVVVGNLLLSENLVISNANNNTIINENGLIIENGVNRFMVDVNDIKGLLKIDKYDSISNAWKPQMHIDTNGYLRFSDGTIIGNGSKIEGAQIGNGTNIDWSKINKIDANYIITDTLDTSIANILNLTAGSATINNLNTKYLKSDLANINIADIDTANINKLISKDGVIFNLASANTVIDEGVIKNLIAKRITVSDLLAGAINTKNFTIQSDDGTQGLKIVGNTLQMYDSNGNVGIQLGYSLNDGVSRPHLLLTDTKGAVMLDSEGLHENIIPDKFIKANMVADKAIGNAQIDWIQTKEVVDKDGNSLWITANQVLNSNEFTTKFTTITEDVDRTKTSITELEQSIDAENKTIKESIKETIFLRDVDGNIVNDEFGNPILISRKISEQEQSLGGFRRTISNTEAKVDASVKTIIVEYYISTSSTKLIGGTWGSDVPSILENKFIWERQKTTYNNGRETDSTPVCITGKDAKLLSLSSTSMAVAFNNNGTLKDSTNITLTVEQQNYSDEILWTSTPTVTLTGTEKTRTLSPTVFSANSQIKITVSSGELSDTVTIVKIQDGNTGAKGESGAQGIQGIQGETGERGIAGANGINGQTTYFHIKYASVQNPTAAQMTETPNTFIGTYVDFISGDSNDPLKYSWSRFTGLQGANGEKGIPGVNGANGKTTYLHIKYASVQKPTAAQMNDIGGDYIGQYTDFVELDSNDPLLYTWTKIKGEQGAQGVAGVKGADGKQYYTWLKYADSPTSGMSDAPDNKAYIGLAYNKATATESSVYTDYTWSLVKGAKGDTGVAGVKGADGKQYYTWLKYADSPTTGISDVSTGKKYIGLAYNKLTATESNVYADYTWSLIQGEKGATGDRGANGQDSYTVILSNEAHIFAGNTTAAIAQNVASQISAFKGATQVAATIGTITGMPAGMNVSLQNNGTSTAQFTVSTTAAMVSKNGTLSIPITVDGKKFTKYFTYALSLQGVAGQGIASLTSEYAISTSKTIAPTSGWTTTAPLWDTGKYIWTRSKIVYKDPVSTVYTAPTCDSAWEAVNGVQVGGRNLVRGTENQRDCKPVANIINSCSEFYTIIPGDKSIGQEYTVSFDLSWTKFTQGTSGVFSLWFQGVVDKNWGYVNPFTNAVIKENGVPIAFSTLVKRNDGQIHVAYTIKIADQTQANCKSFGFGLRCDNSDGTGSITISKFKVEKGNKPTDWTAAPEDVDEKINEANIRLGLCESNINQTAKDIILEVSETYVDNDTFTEYKESRLEMTKEAIEMKFTELNDIINGVNETVSGNQEKLESYIRFNDDGIELGEKKDGKTSPFTAVLTNETLSFNKNDKSIASVSGEALHITNAEINNSIRIGNFAFKPRGNGNLSLVFLH